MTGLSQHARVAARIAVVAALAIAPARALETDPYYAWGRQLADATDIVNAKFDLELGRVLDRVNAPGRGRPVSCETVAREFRARLHSPLIHSIELWALQSPLVPRVPGRDEELAARRVDLLSNHGPFDVGTWIPLSPTIEVGGVRIGIEKLGHMISSGWRYHQKYQHALERHATLDDAEALVVQWGILEEATVLGKMSDGIFSLADMEANFGGMKFFIDLCNGDEPVLELAGGAWRARRPIDLSRYVTPQWDESFNVSIFSEGRWRKVRPVLLRYCSRRGDPEVVARFARYRETDRDTPTDRAVRKLVAEGKLIDPARFGLAANCPDEPPVREPDVAPPAPPPQDGRDLARAIVEEERDLEARVYQLTGLGFSYPRGLAGSWGALFANQPIAHDCHTICELKGALLQLSPGLHGATLGLGYAPKVVAETRHHESWLSDVYIAYAVKGALLRTWSGSPLDPEVQTLAGVEGEFTITRVNFSLGLFRPVSGGAGSEWVVAAGIGWGM